MGTHFFSYEHFMAIKNLYFRKSNFLIMEELELSSASKKTKTIYISTVISITLVLLMVGFLGLILVHAKRLSDYVKENMVLNIIVNDGAKEKDIFSLQKEINANPAILQTKYIGKEAAARSLTKDLGEDFVEFLGYNPLLPSVDVYLKADYANDKSMKMLTEELLKNPLVKEIVYQRSLIQMVDQNIQEISLIILSFAFILLVVSIALINNTIRLAIHSQRFLIKSMQLVGATKSFIRKPFMKYSVIHGLLAGIIAIILLILTLCVAQQQIPEICTLSNWTEFIIVFALDIGIGILISVLSTYFAVSKYLRLQIYDLYR